MKIGVVGCGVVGSAMARLFGANPANELVIYDKFVPPHDRAEHKLSINSCDLTFLCVPTPTAADGMSCDLTAVNECAGWITVPLCIRSTVIPGTVERLAALTGNLIAFSPEYLGESRFHPWKEAEECGFLIVGGPPEAVELVTAAYRTSSREDLRIYATDARTAELCKYMENSFLAAKVAFVNQFYDIAQAFGVPFEELRELWLADPRVGDSHTEVTGERGFRGRCLPKDLAAITAAMKPLGGAPLLEAIRAYNEQLCRKADQSRAVAAVAGGPL
jgi:UDPglucose 6-dehydrogenase